MWQENAIFEKEYRKIEFKWGSNLEKAVNTLLEYKEKGILAFGDFNGRRLYSDTITLDGAYIEIVGCTKDDFDKRIRERDELWEREEKEHKDRIPALKELWIKKGMETLDEKYWDYWYRVVPNRLSDLYRGMELDCCLKIVSILNEGGSLEEAKEELESQDHSGMSYGLVCTMVKEFCGRGNEFVEYVK